jgi:hypothetical protein
MFDFDWELFKTKVYRTAIRSNMEAAILETSEDKEKTRNSTPTYLGLSQVPTEAATVNKDLSKPTTVEKTVIQDLGVSQSQKSEPAMVDGTSSSREEFRPRMPEYPLSKSPQQSLAAGSPKEKDRGSWPKPSAYRKMFRIPSLVKAPTKSANPFSHLENIETTWKAPQQVIIAPPQKVIILGISGSGKSTLPKCIKFSTNGFSKDEYESYKMPIFKNTITAMNDILEARTRYRLARPNVEPDIKAFELQAQKLLDIGIKTFSELECLPSEIAPYIKALFSDSSIREAFKRDREGTVTDCAE